VTRWYGPRDETEPTFGEIIHQARRQMPGAERRLLSLANQDTIPAIMRATLLDELRRTPSRLAVEAVIKAIDDADPLVRYHALGALQMLPPGERWQFAEHRLQDTVLSVRSEAGRVLAGSSRDRLSPDQLAVLDAAIADYLAIQAFDADHPTTYVNVGLLEAARGRPEAADSAYREAMEVDAEWLPAYVNLADLYRAQSRDEEAEAVLRSALGVVTETSAIRHALGLLLVRTGRMDEALESGIAVCPGGALSRPGGHRQRPPDSLAAPGRRADARAGGYHALRVRRHGTRRHGETPRLIFVAARLFSGHRSCPW